MKIAAKIWILIGLGLGMLMASAPAFAAPLIVPVIDGENSAEDVTLYTNSYALVVGINEYSSGWPRLNNAVKDARLIAAAMEKKGFDVTLIENPDRRELDQAIEEFFVLRGENPDDRLFFWFAGHGYTENGEGYLIPSDGLAPEKGGRFRLSAIRLRDINTYVRLAQSKHVYAVFDACFAGTIFSSSRARPPAAITRAAIKPVRQFLTSGDAYQKVSDDGSFRELFLKALAGEEAADLNKDGFLTASEMGYFMDGRITNLTQGLQTPRFGKLRDKNFDQGDFIFALPGRQRPPPRQQTTASEGSSTLQSGKLKLQIMKMESQFWESIQGSQDPADFEDFIAQFPDGTFTRMARRRLARLSTASAPEPVPAAPEEDIQVAAINPEAATIAGAEKPAPVIPEASIPTAKADPPAQTPDDLSPVQKSLQEQFTNYTPGTLEPVVRRDPSLPELPPGDTPKTDPDDIPEAAAPAEEDMATIIQKSFPDFIPGTLEPVVFSSRSDERTDKEAASSGDSAGSSAASCEASEQAMRTPIDMIFQSWEDLAVEPYMSQWAEDAVQYKATGASRNKASIRKVREGLFPLLKSVSVEETRMSLLDSGDGYAVFENIYTMEFRYKTGRVVREENDLETYLVTCDAATGQWLIAENTDLPEE